MFGLIGDLVTVLVIQPLFNFLVLIYALMPGHNFGLAIIIFTAIVRILMWPLVKKQLHQAKAMRELQPELKRIKLAAKGDRQKESTMMLELYKEREINPFASIGMVFLQLPIFIGLYSGLNKIVKDPNQIVDFSYSFIRNLPWIETLSKDIKKFDSSLFNIVDLNRAAISNGKVYIPAMVIVVASVVIQYFQAKQLMPQAEKKRSLKEIMSEASQGKQADQSEINAAIGSKTIWLMPGFIFIFTVNIASALSLYWLTSGLVALYQQNKVLNQDKDEMVSSTTATTSNNKVIEAEIIPPKKNKNKNTNRKGNKKKRR